MSEIQSLTVTVELSAHDFMEHEGAPLVRCPLNGVWVPLTEYYSENQDSLLPLVGNVNYEEAHEHWIETPEGMKKEEKVNRVAWKEVVRVLPKIAEEMNEADIVTFNTSEQIGTGDRMT